MASQLCSNGCGFYGHASTNNMCSRCYRDFLQAFERMNLTGDKSEEEVVAVAVDDAASVAQPAAALLCSKCYPVAHQETEVAVHAESEQTALGHVQLCFGCGFLRRHVSATNLCPECSSTLLVPHAEDHQSRGRCIDCGFLRRLSMKYTCSNCSASPHQAESCRGRGRCFHCGYLRHISATNLCYECILTPPESTLSCKSRRCCLSCGFQRLITDEDQNLCSQCSSLASLEKDVYQKRGICFKCGLRCPMSTKRFCITCYKSGTPAGIAGPAKRNRCGRCSKKVGLASAFKCRCGSTFCGTHRYPEEHECMFDFKAAGRAAIAKANPLVKADKLESRI